MKTEIQAICSIERQFREVWPFMRFFKKERVKENSVQIFSKSFCVNRAIVYFPR